MVTSDIIIGIPTLWRYDLLDDVISCIRNGTVQPHDIYIIDNGQNYKSNDANVIKSPYNLGCAGSWNKLCDLADSENRDIFIINDDILLFKNSFERIQSLIKEYKQHPVSKQSCCIFGYSAFWIGKELRQQVGRFDEYIWPVYWEDCDYSWRIKLKYGKKEQLINNDNYYLHHNGGSQTINALVKGWDSVTKNYITKKWGKHLSWDSFEYKEPFQGKKFDLLEDFWSNYMTYKELQVYIEKYVRGSEVLLIGENSDPLLTACIAAGKKKVVVYDKGKQPGFDYHFKVAMSRDVELQIISSKKTDGWDYVSQKNGVEIYERIL